MVVVVAVVAAAVANVDDVDDDDCIVLKILHVFKSLQSTYLLSHCSDDSSSLLLKSYIHSQAIQMYT